ELPDDAGHLVAVELDDGIVHLDFRHDIPRVENGPRPSDCFGKCGPYSIGSGEGKGDERMPRQVVENTWSISASLRIAEMLQLLVFTQFRARNRNAFSLECS